MARIEKAILGFVSGRLGDVVFRKMNGKKFISVAPKKYKISQSAKANKGRANFAALIKLAKAVNSVPGLKEAWNTAKVEGTNSYHKIIRYNGKFVNSGKLTAANKITPDGLQLEIIFADIQQGKMNVEFSFQTDKIKLPTLLSIVFGFNNRMVFIQTADIETAEPEDTYTLSIPLLHTIKKELKEDPNPVIYFAVSGIKESNKKIFWTDTVVKE